MTAAVKAPLIIDGPNGELVAIGVLIMSTLQNNRPERVRAIVDGSGMRSTLTQLAIATSEIEASLRRVPSFVAEQGLWYSFANNLVVGEHELMLVRQAVGAEPT